MILEGDASMVIKALQAEEHNDSNVGHLIDSSEKLWQHFTYSKHKQCCYEQRVTQLVG